MYFWSVSTDFLPLRSASPVAGSGRFRSFQRRWCADQAAKRSPWAASETRTDQMGTEGGSWLRVGGTRGAEGGGKGESGVQGEAQREIQIPEKARARAAVGVDWRAESRTVTEK